MNFFHNNIEWILAIAFIILTYLCGVNELIYLTYACILFTIFLLTVAWLKDIGHTVFDYDDEDYIN